jgi:hypothetical protein
MASRFADVALAMAFALLPLVPALVAGDKPGGRERSGVGGALAACSLLSLAADGDGLWLLRVGVILMLCVLEWE